MLKMNTIVDLIDGIEMTKAKAREILSAHGYCFVKDFFAGDFERVRRSFEVKKQLVQDQGRARKTPASRSE